MDELELNSWFCDCAEGRRLPVRLSIFLPHYRIKLRVVLIAKTQVFKTEFYLTRSQSQFNETHLPKNESDIVIIQLSVHKEGSFKVHAAETMKSFMGKEKVKLVNFSVILLEKSLPTANPGSLFIV